MKKLFLSFSVLIFSLTLVLPAYADCSGGQCAMKHGSGGGHSEGRDEYQCPIVAKLMKKAHFFLENEKELGLKEDQVKTIKELKLEAKKAYVRQKAEMEVFHLDLESKMSVPKVDVEGINAMIDSGMAAMTANAKATVASYAKLKSTLTDDQMAKAKEIWIKGEKS